MQLKITATNSLFLAKWFYLLTGWYELCASHITDDITNYGYYVLPPNGNGTTYSPSEFANIGIILSDNNFDFHILGHDFDNDQLTYVFADLPLGLYGDSITGWVSGNPVISPDTISKFNFSVSVRKTNNKQNRPM